MKSRVANKILSTTNYYDILENPENGKLCYVPISQKHLHLMCKACQTLGCMDIYEDMVAGITEAFDEESLK